MHSIRISALVNILEDSQTYKPSCWCKWFVCMPRVW